MSFLLVLYSTIICPLMQLLSIIRLKDIYCKIAVSKRIMLKYMSMGRKRKAQDFDIGETLKLISRETANTIFGIFAMVAAFFFLLGAFGAGGRVGDKAFELLSALFGIGYYLLPVVFALLSVSLLHEREREFALPQILGSTILFLSGLGLVELLSEKGGLIVGLISGPLVSLFDIWVTGVVLVALIIVSVLVIFDIPIKFNLNKLLPEKKRNQGTRN